MKATPRNQVFVAYFHLLSRNSGQFTFLLLAKAALSVYSK